MKAYKRGSNYYITFYFNGKRIRRKSPVNTMGGAMNYGKFIADKMQQGLDPFKTEKPELTFAGFTKIWIEKHVKINNKPSGLKDKTTILNNYLIPFFGTKKLNAIRYSHIVDYTVMASKKGLKNKTINNHLSVLNTCLTHAVEWGESNNVLKMKWMKVPLQDFDYLSFEESDRLLNLANGVIWDMIFVALKTGMRYGELRALTWSCIDLENEQLCVQRAFFVNQLGLPKNGKTRYIPLTDNLLDFFKRKKKKKGYVFSINNTFIESNKAYRDLKIIVRQLNLDDGRKISWHALRHTFASQSLMSGASLSAIREFLGHSDIKTTMRYAHLSKESLKEQINLLEKNKNNHLGHSLGTDQERAKQFNDLIRQLSSSSSAKDKQKQARTDLSLD